MKFIIGQKREPEAEVKLTLEEGVGGIITLKANGKSLMGFYDGKYRLYSNASTVDGLRFSRSLLMCHN